jgi:hypothetical protein
MMVAILNPSVRHPGESRTARALPYIRHPGESRDPALAAARDSILVRYDSRHSKRGPGFRRDDGGNWGIRRVDGTQLVRGASCS